jgi:hypothetical protein
MNDDLINDKNYKKFMNYCKSLNISIVKDDKKLKKGEILEKVNNYKVFLKRKTLKLLDDYYKNIDNGNFIIMLEKIYKCVKKYDNKLNFIIDYLNDEYSDTDINSLFLESSIDLLNIEIEIEDIEDNSDFLDEYKNS